jgi:hypothetical protein
VDPDPYWSLTSNSGSGSGKNEYGSTTLRVIFSKKSKVVSRNTKIFLLFRNLHSHHFAKIKIQKEVENIRWGIKILITFAL